jgi:hypothetical protein
MAVMVVTVTSMLTTVVVTTTVTTVVVTLTFMTEVSAVLTVGVTEMTVM